MKQTSRRRSTAAAMVGVLALFAFGASEVASTQNEAVAAVPSCPGGTDVTLTQERRDTAASIAAESAGNTRLVIDDAAVTVSDSPSFTFSLQPVVEYSVYADTVVEVARNLKMLGNGWGRVSLKISESTGCAWALISDKDATGTASFWVDVASDRGDLDRFDGLVGELDYDTRGRDAFHGPTVPIPTNGNGALRACAMFEADNWVTHCTEWVYAG